MNEKDVKKEVTCDVCEIQNAGLVSACLDLKDCVKMVKPAPMCIELLEGIRNNLEVYDCEITKKLIRRVQFILGKIRATPRDPIIQVITETEKALLRMLLNELNEVIRFSSDPIR